VVKTFLQLVGLIATAQQQILDQFRQLNQHLDAIAGALSWQMGELERENRLATMIASVLTAGQDSKSGLPFDNNAPAAFNSAQAVIQSEQPLAFKRKFLEAATDGPWKKIIIDRPEHDDFVYDWRFGVPALSELIGMRILVIAAIKPDFVSDGSVFHDELMLHRSALQMHYQNMVNGVRCNTTVEPPDDPTVGPVNNPNWTFHLGCAEIYSGLYALKDLSYANVWPLDTEACTQCTVDETGTHCTTDMPCAQREAADYQSWYATNVQAVQDDLRRQVLGQMPLFDMQALIDTLYKYANPTPELTEKGERIPATAARSLCVDAQGGGIAPGTSLWLMPCASDNQAYGQHWSYDRAGQTIRNSALPSLNRCIAVSNADRTPGALVQVANCDGSDAQRWTYDPETGVLTGKVGTVLEIQAGTLQPRAVLQTGVRNDGPAQQWYPDPASFSMSVAPTSVSIAANDSTSIQLSTMMLAAARPIGLTFSVPTGLVIGASTPAMVIPGQGLSIGIAVPLGTPAGAKGSITIVGTNGIETHSISIDATTTACVPTSCQALGAQCGSLSDMCGHTLSCGECGTGLTCASSGMCIPRICTRPHPCPRGSHWDDVDCACVAD
jgi:hypothetical protein